MYLKISVDSLHICLLSNKKKHRYLISFAPFLNMDESDSFLCVLRTASARRGAMEIGDFGLLVRSSAHLDGVCDHDALERRL